MILKAPLGPVIAKLLVQVHVDMAPVLCSRMGVNRKSVNRKRVNRIKSWWLPLLLKLMKNK